MNKVLWDVKQRLCPLTSANTTNTSAAASAAASFISGGGGGGGELPKTDGSDRRKF